MTPESNTNLNLEVFKNRIKLINKRVPIHELVKKLIPNIRFKKINHITSVVPCAHCNKEDLEQYGSTAVISDVHNDWYCTHCGADGTVINYMSNFYNIPHALAIEIIEMLFELRLARKGEQ